MSSIPSNLARVPSLLASQIMLGSLQRSSQSLLTTQLQLASGRQVNRPSDDAVGSSTVSVLDDIIERRAQRLRNLSHADSVLNNLDAALGDAGDLLIEAKGIASSQIGVGSDPQTRANEATVIDAMINQLVNISNRQYQQIYFFGGDATAQPPIVELLGGLRYQGQGDGLETDLGVARGLPITLSGREAFGALSARVQGEVDLDPSMIASTRLVDLDGARGLGVSLGSINVNINGTDVVVDLTTAHTVQDVIDTLQTGIPGSTVAINAAGNALEITAGAGDTVVISDLVGEATAADLGIVGTFTGAGPTAGADVNPLLTERSLIAGLATGPLGSIRLTNGNLTRDLDLSSAQTIQDVMNLVHGLDQGIRVEIAATGDRLNFVNELSGTDMAIGEVAGGTTATDLGVRSLSAQTRLADFNHGRGVQIRSGSVDPVTGLPDPAADLDFRVTLKDGRAFDVDLAGSVFVQDVLDAINAAATAAGVGVPAEFQATLASDGNGMALADNTGPGTTSVTALNGSFAAGDLGLIGSTSGAILTGEDRATVAVDSVFTHLIDLRDALLADDTTGITLAAERLEQDIVRVAEARGKVGVLSRRVMDASDREEDLRIQDMSLRSEIRDLDFTEAAMRFANLQQQLQAGLTTTAQVTSLSLLDFLR